MEQLIVHIKKNHPNAVIPKYNIPGEDAGLDLVAVDKKIDENKKFIEYNLGISIEIPKGYVGLIFPRSSVTKQDLLLKNSVGVIDSGYRGNIVARFQSVAMASPVDFYNIGDKVCQLIIIPYPEIILKEVEELSSSVRGEGGFGSSGK